MDSSRRVSNARRVALAIVLTVATAAFAFLAVAPHVGGQQPTTPYAAIASDVPPERLPPGGTASLRRAAQAVCADLRHGPGHYGVPGYPDVTLRHYDPRGDIKPDGDDRHDD